MVFLQSINSVSDKKITQSLPVFIDVAKACFVLHPCNCQKNSNYQLYIHVAQAKQNFLHNNFSNFHRTEKLSALQYFDFMARFFSSTASTVATSCSYCNRHCVNIHCGSGSCGWWSSECKCYNCVGKHQQVYPLIYLDTYFYTYRISFKKIGWAVGI